MPEKVGSAYLTVEPKLSNDFSKQVEEKGAPAGTGFGGKFSKAAHAAMGAGLVALGNIIANVASTAASAIGDFVADSIQTGANFEKSMSQVAATMGVSVDQIQDLSAFAKEMGATTAFSATQAADALNYMALAGYSSEEAMQALPNVLNLAAAGNIDLARASDMVTDAQSALGLSMNESAVMVDQMAKAASKSNTSVAQLGDAFLTVGATARGMAGGTQEMATVLGVLADNGIKGAEGGTHLRNILLSLQGAAVDGVAAFGDFNVAIYDSEGNMRSTVDIIKDMQAGLGEMDAASRDAILSGVFNKTDLASVNALLGTSTERFDELSAAIGDSAGAAQQMAETQLDNLTGDVTLFQSALEGVQIALFEGVSPALRGLVQLGTSALGGLLELGNQMGAAFAASPIPGMLEAIGAAFASVGAQISEAFMPVFDSMSSTVSSVMPSIQSIIGTAMGFIGSIISNVWGVVSDVIVGAMTTIAGIISDNWPLIELLTTNVMTAIQAIAEDVWPALSTIITSAVNQIRSIISIVWPIIQTIVTTVFAAVLTIANAVWPSVALIVTTAIDVISGVITSLSSIVDIITGIFNGVKSAIEGPMNAARDFIGNIIDTIKGYFNFQISWPHIPLPHFSVSGSVNPLDWLESGPPSFNVEWYASGGIINGATLIGAGEAGPEMILPKSGGLMTDFAEAVASEENDEELIRWLSRNLGRIIHDNAPTISRRDFDRMARGAVS